VDVWSTQSTNAHLFCTLGGFLSLLEPTPLFGTRRAVPGLPLAKSSWRESAVFGQRDGKVPTIVENPECGR
jgi:hypothetical protein